MAYITNKTTNKTGSNITINNAINYKLLNTQLLGNLEQDGTPTTSVPIPIDVATGLQNITINDTTYQINLGKNLFSGFSSIGSGNTYADGVLTVNNNRANRSNNIKVKPNTIYYFNYSASTASRRYFIYEYNSAGTQIKSTTKYAPTNITTDSATSYIVIGFAPQSGTTYPFTITDFQFELGNQATTYAEYFTPIELCEIVNNQDKIYKSSNKWYIEKNIAKIDSYNGETITTDYVSTTGGLDTGATIYYALTTPTTTEITNTTLINELEALSKAKLDYGINNIIVNGNLPSILDLTAYTSENPYQDVIYSQDDRNKAKIWFNDVEMVDFGTKCEKITKTSRILPNDGKKVFSLSNFVATELEVILHDVDVEDLVDQVKISIGTIVGSDSLGDTYEWIPLGVFNIQDQPVINDNKITLKLRDNRVKLDFGYNAKPLIDANGGSATKRQIFEDICTQAGVEHEVPYFEFENDYIGIYDDTVQAQTYIAYLAEQSGSIPTINRDGKLIFVDFNNLFTWRIPRSLLANPFKVETQYQVQRVVYESGIIKYETSINQDLETLYLNANNPYINRQEQINYIFNKLNGFTLDSITTPKILGNPAIDPYDIIEIYDDTTPNQTVIARTFANNVYNFNGKHNNTFQTTIGKEQRKENVTKNNALSFQNWAKTTINNIEGTVEIYTGKVNTLQEESESNYTSLQTSVTQLQTDTYTKTQIQEITSGNGYFLTNDTKYQSGVDYYVKNGDNYDLLVVGTDYNIGDDIPSDTVYEYGTVTAVVSAQAKFDKNGMRYSSSDDDPTTLINYKGLEVDDKNNNELLFAGVDQTTNTSIVRTDNLTVTTYLRFANGKGRFEEYTDGNGHTGVGFFLT